MVILMCAWNIPFGYIIGAVCSGRGGVGVKFGEDPVETGNILRISCAEFCDPSSFCHR